MVGATPPPRNGMSVVTETLPPRLQAEGLFVDLVDTADRRGLSNVGKLDTGNVLNALRCGLEFVLRALTRTADVAYVPIAQNRLGFLRDSLFLAPARVLGLPVVVHLHGCAFKQFVDSEGAVLRGLVKYCLSRADLAVVLGAAAANEFEGLIGADRVRIVENGVPDVMALSTSDEAAHTGIGQIPEGRFVLYLSTLTLGKGFLDLMDAVPLLHDVDDLHFVFAGEFASDAARCAARCRLEDAESKRRITVMGPVDAETAAGLLGRSLALVLPARQVEGQPLCILEAFSAGVPVVVTRSGCVVDTVDDGTTGVFVDSGAPSQISEAIRALALDEDLRERLSRNARRTFEHRFTLEAWGQSMAAVLREAAQPR